MLEPAITIAERELLAGKIAIGSISPIQLKDQDEKQKLMDFEAEISAFEGIQDLAVIKILRLVPNLDPKIFKRAI